MLSPLLGVSREGTTVTFRTASDVAWTVLHDGGKGEYDTLERTSTSLTLRAGHAGGGKYSIVAKLDTPACATAPAVPGATSSKCVYSAVWHIMWPWQVRAALRATRGGPRRRVGGAACVGRRTRTRARSCECALVNAPLGFKTRTLRERAPRCTALLPRRRAAGRATRACARDTRRAAPQPGPDARHARPRPAHPHSARSSCVSRTMTMDKTKQAHVLSLLLSSIVALLAFYSARFVRVRFFPAKEYSVRSPSPMRHLKLNGL
jgi:hypothetical protein